MCLENITRVHSIIYPIKQTTIGLVGFSILHHSMQNAKCQSRGLAGDVMGPRLRVRSQIYLGRVELNSQRLESKKHFHN